MTERPDIQLLPPAMRAMADPTRLKILLMLEGAPRTVGEIVSFFNLSQPTITRHLQTLTLAGLVKRARQGQHVRYELNTANLQSFCIDLVACFPCCCVAVRPNQSAEAQQGKSRKRMESIPSNKSTLSKRKGDR